MLYIDISLGTHMLDKCPKFKSCGSYNPLWTDDEMPKNLGVVSNVNVYAVFKDTCKDWELPLQVIRCSWKTNNDFVYRYAGNYHKYCPQAFCGMN